MKRPTKVALLGFDCAVTPLVRRHIEEGICPNFKRMFENGTVAENCLVPFPTITPPNWTAMATGAWPGTNNITDFTRHIPGTSPEGANTHNCFNWEHVASESFWEAAEKVGKRSIIFNYPMSYNAHKRLKDSIVLGGAALTPGVFMDAEWISREFNVERAGIGAKFAFCEDVLVSTDIHPGNSVRIDFVKASGWKNVEDMGDDPLDISYEMPFSESLFNTKPATWHILVRDLGDGYNTVTLSPTKDFKDAYFTITTGTWSEGFDADGLLADGSIKKIRMMAKLITLDEDDASSFKLFLSHALNTDGEYWVYPPEKAKMLNKGNNIATNNTGMLALSLGWIDLDTWLEIIGLHYEWLADSIIALVKAEKWDIFYSHAHPTDYIYHVLMTELDSNTCSSEAMYTKAWQLHAQLYKYADRYLGRLLEVFDDGETLINLISDHGATPDGHLLNMDEILGAGGFCERKEMAEPEWLKGVPENIRANFAKLGVRMNMEVSTALPIRSCYVNINLKGRDPEGIVDPKDYKKVQRDVCDYLLTYIDPRTNTRPFSLALPKEEAKMMGLWGDQCGDVVYAVYPEFAAQHGPILPSTSIGEVGEMRPLCVFYGPGVKKGYSMERVCNLVDLVPTFCHLTGWPVPETTEGAIIYQMIEK